MRKSKYDQSSLPVQDSKSIDSDDNISKIENRVDFETELVNLTNQIKDIKDVIQELKQIKAFEDASVLTFEESAQVLNTAVKTSDNIPDTISRAIIQAENTVINVKLSVVDKSILIEYRNKLIDEEVVQKADPASLDGKTISFTGCFTANDNEKILITPVELEAK